MAWLTTKQAAEKLGVTEMRVRQYLQAGDIKGQKFGQVWMVSAAAVASFKRPEMGRPPKCPPPTKKKSGSGSL